jgi:hypothetical protein
MALVGTISGSVGPGGTVISNTAISGTLVVANSQNATFPSIFSDAIFYVSGSATSGPNSVIGTRLVVSGAILANLGMTGSITKLPTGGDYLVAGSNISLVTGSDGSVTISSTIAGTSPGGSSNEVQYNSLGSFAGDNSFSFDSTAKTVSFTSGSAYHISASLGVYAPVFHSGLLTLADAASISWNLNLGSVAQVTLGGARSLAAPTNQRQGAVYTLIVKQDSTGNRTLSFDSTYKFPYASDPTFTTASNSVDIVSFISDGTNMYGSVAFNFG